MIQSYVYFRGTHFLALQNHKTIQHVAEYQDDDSDDGVGDCFLCSSIFLFIPGTCQDEESGIDDHDHDDEREEAIQEDNDLCDNTENASAIKNSIRTICRNAKYLVIATITSSIGDSYEWLCDYHDKKSNH